MQIIKISIRTHIKFRIASEYYYEYNQQHQKQKYTYLSITLSQRKNIRSKAMGRECDISKTNKITYMEAGYQL